MVSFVPDVIVTNATLLLPALVAMVLLGAVWLLTAEGQKTRESKHQRVRRRAEALKHAESILDSGGFTLQPWLEPLDGSDPRSASTGWFTATSAIFVYWLCSNVYFNVTTNGTPFHDGGAFFFSMVNGFSNLVVAVAVVVGVYSLAFPYQLAVTAGWIPRGITQTLVQTSVEIAMLAAVIVFTQYSSMAKDWMFSQKAGLLFEAAVLVMKAHSYLSVNRALAEGKPAGFGGSGSALASAESEGQGAEFAAAEARAESDAVNDRQRSTATAEGAYELEAVPAEVASPESSATSNPATNVEAILAVAPAEGDDAFSLDGDEYVPGGAFHLTKRSSTAETQVDGEEQEQEQDQEEEEVEDQEEETKPTSSRKRSSSSSRPARKRPAAPEEAVEETAAAALTMTPSELQDVHYPDNVTLADFVRFSFMPTVVYSPSYPSTATFRWHYFVEKIVLAALVLLTALEIAVQFCVPVARDIAHGYSRADAPSVGAGEVIARLIVPVAILMILIFFFVFEIFLNAMAELTFYGDRRFYGDWWNSTSFKEFSRKWNKPIHNWLLHHIYLPLQATGLHPTIARYSTFAISIVAHEMVLHGFFGIISPWLMVFSLLQFPLFVIMQRPVFKGKRLGNLVFWFGMALGVPLVGALYLNEFCSSPEHWNLCGAE